MATLDKVVQMQGQGMPDAQIITQLTNEGVSPKEINDSLNQARVKTAISAEPATANVPLNQPPITNEIPGAIQASGSPQGQNIQQPSLRNPAMSGAEAGALASENLPISPSMQGPNTNMQASIMPTTQEIPANAPQIQPQTPQPEMYPPEASAAPQEYAGQDYDNYYQETPQAYDQGYYDEGYGEGTGYVDTEVISEVAEQVASEKISEFKKSVGDIASFKSTIQDKVDDIDDRLKRIENSIDKLQHAVINKVGEFGENSAIIHRDLDNLHGTVSKMIDPLMDNYNELKKLNDKQNS